MNEWALSKTLVLSNTAFELSVMSSYRQLKSFQRFNTSNARVFVKTKQKTFSQISKESFFFSFPDRDVYSKSPGLLTLVRIETPRPCMSFTNSSKLSVA